MFDGTLSKLRLWSWVCLVTAMLVACSGDAQEPSVASGATSPTASTPSPLPFCPNPEGQACLGELVAGTYTTMIFTPTLTYTVPAGWSNLEDMPGNFLLVPPRGNLPGVNADTSDFIGVYSSVAAADGCPFHEAPDVERSPSGIAGWMARNPGLAITNRHDVVIGGLKGVVFDIKLAKGWTKACPYTHGTPLVPLIVGVGLSGLEHGSCPRARHASTCSTTRLEGRWPSRSSTFRRVITSRNTLLWWRRCVSRLDPLAQGSFHVLSNVRQRSWERQPATLAC